MVVIDDWLCALIVVYDWCRSGLGENQCWSVDLRVLGSSLCENLINWLFEQELILSCGDTL